MSVCVLPEQIRADMARLAEAATPHEACGLLVVALDRGRYVIRRLLPSDNVTALNPTAHFEVDPALILSTQRALRSEAGAVMGVWHSHPSGAAIPSETDRARATDHRQLWLISAPRAGVWDTRAYEFLADMGDFHPIMIQP